jgi:integrase
VSAGTSRNRLKPLILLHFHPYCDSPTYSRKWDNMTGKGLKMAHLTLVSTPIRSTENGTKRKMPNRKENDRLRGRFHLTEAEVRLLKETALKDNFYGFRDASMVSLAYRSCLRVGELVGLTWDDVELRGRHNPYPQAERE